MKRRQNGWYGGRGHHGGLADRAMLTSPWWRWPRYFSHHAWGRLGRGDCVRTDADGKRVVGVLSGGADGVEAVGDDAVGGTDDARDLRRVSISSSRV